MEATVAKTALDATMRSHGFGGALQSIRVTGFIRFDAKYALYGLAEKPDVDAAAGLLSLVGMSPTTLELGELGTAQALDTRSDGPHAHVIFHGPKSEAADDDDAKKVPGWIALVDDPDRYKWLRGRETEADAGPAGYFAIGDLWALIESFEASPREFMFAAAWLRGRKLAFVLDPAEDGAPQMRARLSKP
jgi:hypothetical protein